MKRRVLFWFSIGTVVTVVAMAMAIVLAVSHSRRQLEIYKQQLAERGEYLDVARLAPPPPPNENNGAADLLAAARALPTPGDNVTLLRAGIESSPGQMRVAHRETLATISGTKTVSWQEARAGLEKVSPLLISVRSAAAAPILEFQPDYTQGIHMRLDGVSECLRSTQFLYTEALIDLHDGNPSAAQANLTTMLRLAGMMQKQTVVISGLVASGILTLSQALTWELLQTRGLTDAELQSVQKEWEKSAQQAATLVPAMRMERAAAITVFESPSAELSKSISALSSSSSGPMSPSWVPAGEWIDTGAFLAWTVFLRHADERHYLEEIQSLIDRAPADAAQGPWIPYLQQGAVIQAGIADAGFERMMSRLMVPALDGWHGKMIAMEAVVHLTVAAIALERHRLATGTFPAKLEELVPTFLSRVPSDPIDGKSLRYQRNGDGFLLYSTGIDGIDDGGDTNAKKRRSFIDGRDIVWPQLAP